MYNETAEILKPSIKIQKNVKKTIDEKQNELIKQLQKNKETVDRKQDEVIQQLKENQVELSSSIDVLSDIMSKQGSVSGVEKWVGSLPSHFDPLDTIGEEGAEEGEEESAEEGEEEGAEKGAEEGAEEGAKFSSQEIDILKKYNFDPKFEKIPTNDEIKKAFAKTTGKKNSKDKVIRNIAHKESSALSKYNNHLKQLKKGEGIRRYNQPKRNAYKISQRGQYGGLVIDLPKLHGHLKVVAHKNGRKVYDKQADFDTLDLLTKRFNSKKRYSELTRSIFTDLNRLSEIPIHRTSKKYSKLGSGVVYYNNPEDLLSRLELLGGVYICWKQQ